MDAVLPEESSPASYVSIKEPSLFNCGMNY